MKYLILILLLLVVSCKSLDSGQTITGPKEKKTLKRAKYKSAKRDPKPISDNDSDADVEDVPVTMVPPSEPKIIIGETQSSEAQYGSGSGYSGMKGEKTTTVVHYASRDTDDELHIIDNSKPLKDQIGLIAYSVPEEMQLGKDYGVKIRISKEDIKEELIKGSSGIAINDPNVESIITIENVRVSSVMSASLLASKDDYLIESLSTETQNLETLGYTEWAWNVKPVKGGNNVLKLIVKVRVEQGDEKFFKDIVVFEKNISIKTNLGYSIETFFAKYWQWFMTTFLIPLFLWWYNRKKKKKNED